MPVSVRADRLALAVASGFVAYLLWGTGLATDDYVHLLHGLTRSIGDHWWPHEYLSVPVLHYTHGVAFYIFGGKLWAYDLLKAVYAGAGVYFASRFFQLFCGRRRALVLAFLFIFFPLHDAATFWLTGLYLVLSFSCYLFAYAQGAAGHYRWTVLFALLGSFSSYGSPPIALGLTVLAMLERRRMLAAALFVPNLLYIAYYLVTSVVLSEGTRRLTGDFNLPSLAKNMAIQILTFFDAAAGPSAWAKLFYSWASLSGVGLVIGLLVTAGTLRFIATEQASSIGRNLLFAALIILVSALGMFALTGLYPQLAFSLGDRVMIYGSFFLVALLVVLPLPRLIESIVVAALFLAIAGISNHWKNWNQTVIGVAANIRSQEAIRKLPEGTRLYVSGYQYSRLGPYCHIDFLTADYVAATFFSLQMNNKPQFRATSFNRRLVYENGELRDRKYGDSTSVAGSIWLYDAERNRLDNVPVSDLPSRLASLPDETRHWTQQLGDGWLKTRLLEAIPRLRYAY